VPIEQKLTIITMLSALLALLLTCVGLALYERMSFRDALTEDLLTTAQIMGDNSVPALAQSDPLAPSRR